MESTLAAADSRSFDAREIPESGRSRLDLDQEQLEEVQALLLLALDRSTLLLTVRGQ